MQRHGLGGRLLIAIEERLGAAGAVKHYQLFTGHRSESNLILYRKHGYLPVATQEVSGRLTLVTLAKDAETGRLRGERLSPGPPQPVQRGQRQQYRDEQIAHPEVRPHRGVREGGGIRQCPGTDDQDTHQLGGAARQRRLAGLLTAAHQRVRDERVDQPAMADSEYASGARSNSVEIW